MKLNKCLDVSRAIRASFDREKPNIKHLVFLQPPKRAKYVLVGTVSIVKARSNTQTVASGAFAKQKRERSILISATDEWHWKVTERNVH